LGGPTTVVLGGHPVEVTDLVAVLLRRVDDHAFRTLGERPRITALSHPADWDRPRRDALVEAAERAGLSNPTLVSEPVAALLAVTDRYVRPTDTNLVVVDLGGGTLDVAVVGRAGDGLTVLGVPQGDRSLGGELFDEVLASYIVARLEDEARAGLDSDDVEWQQAALRLRGEARRAKELLSIRPHADLAVSLPTGTSTLRLTRGEAFSVLGPLLARIAPTCSLALRQAALAPGEIDRVFLVGGASQLPPVVEVVATVFPHCPVLQPPDPKAVVATGAALHASVIAGIRHVTVAVDAPTKRRGTTSIETVSVVEHEEDDLGLGHERIATHGCESDNAERQREVVDEAGAHRPPRLAPEPELDDRSVFRKAEPAQLAVQRLRAILIVLGLIAGITVLVTAILISVS
ncbi:MAG: Hsp70 family protein, partial [Acidimicrobiia bacterium]|nr:Hsp70 family protein [Acidimicrobiia bacterium]